MVEPELLAKIKYRDITDDGERRTLQLQGTGTMHKENGRTVETPVEARAGFLDRPVLLVLVVGTTSALIAMALIYIGMF